MKQITILGSSLSREAQAEALRRFVHRYTGDHKPLWVGKGNPLYPVQFASDADWLAHTYFHVTRGGKLSNRHWSCESHPTWPNNPELHRIPSHRMIEHHG